MHTYILFNVIFIKSIICMHKYINICKWIKNFFFILQIIMEVVTIQQALDWPPLSKMGHSVRHSNRWCFDLLLTWYANIHQEESILEFIYQITEDKSPGNHNWKMEQMEQFSNNLLFHPQAAVVMPTAGLINQSPVFQAEAAVSPRNDPRIRHHPDLTHSTVVLSQHCWSGNDISRVRFPLA